MAELFLDSVIYPVTSLGPGRRIGIWVEGCTLACPGCATPQLFLRDPRHRISVSRATEMLEPLLSHSRRLTISGGEPFQQSAGLVALLASLRARADIEVMIYSGYTMAEIEALGDQACALLRSTDLLVDGRFRIDESNHKIWRGSDNQRIHLLSERARRLGDLDGRYEEEGRSLEVHYRPAAGLRLVGIPKRGLRQQLRAGLKDRGVEIYG